MIQIPYTDNNKRAHAGLLHNGNPVKAVQARRISFFISNWAIRPGSTPKNDWLCFAFYTHETDLTPLMTSENSPPPLSMKNKKPAKYAGYAIGSYLTKRPQ